MTDENDVFLDFFKYNPDKNTVKINISEYEYSKSEFDVNNELGEAIIEMNRLYNLCNDDRIRCDEDANTEYYTREAIEYVPRKELLLLNRRLDYVKDSDEELKIKHQIKILDEVVKKIEDIMRC